MTISSVRLLRALALTGVAVFAGVTSGAEVAAVSSPSLAAPAEEPLCFVREFDAAHLRVTPGRQTRRIAVEIAQPVEDHARRAVTLSLQGRTHRQPLTGGETCSRDTNGHLDCASACTGDRFTVDVAANAQGALVRIVSPRLVFNGACGPARPNTAAGFTPRENERLFQLTRAPAEACRAMRSESVRPG